MNYTKLSIAVKFNWKVGNGIMENRLSPQELVNKFKSIIAANVRRKNDLHEIIKTIDVDNYGIITIYLSRGATYGEAENNDFHIVEI